MQVQLVHPRHNRTVPHIFSTLPNVKLEITRGCAQFPVREVSVPVYLIGSGVDAELVLGDAQFPSIHSCLIVTNSSVLIRLLGAYPPVVVNGRSIQSCELRNGDYIATGPYEFRIHVEVAAALQEETDLRVVDQQGGGLQDEMLDGGHQMVGRLITDIRATLAIDGSEVRAGGFRFEQLVKDRDVWFGDRTVA